MRFTSTEEPSAPRLSFIEGPSAQRSDEFCRAVHDGLLHEPKWLPSRFFYDHRGSELFEQITSLPEYYPTRCEAEILRDFAAEIVSTAGTPLSIVEFGSGSSTKTRQLISSALERQETLRYVTVDISREFLKESADALLAEYEQLSVVAIATEYSQAITMLPAGDERRLILFLGSNIGNFVREEAVNFLTKIRRAMGPEDSVLVGVDLEKDRQVLRLAYNDPQGVTAEFNKNLLARIDRELHGHFDPDAFGHVAIYDEDEHRIEMRLISREDQSVAIDDLETTYSFGAGEPIVTEWSHKYTRESFGEMVASAGLSIEREWTDSRGWFAEFLLRRAEA